MKLRVEWALFAIGAVLIGKCSLDLWAGRFFQSQKPEFARPASVRVAAIAPADYKKTQVLGRLQIPNLGLSVLVVEGDGEDQLRLAAGHVSGTPLPGQSGNSVIAGHRDTFFYDLRKIAAGDKIEFRDRDAVHLYRVSGTRIVDPQEVDVLNNSDGRRLTLVTCYPFSFVGPAPKRFVVFADAIAETI